MWTTFLGYAIWVLWTPFTWKTAEEVARALLPGFIIFRTPVNLQAESGRESFNSVFLDLSTQWPDLKLVTERPRIRNVKKLWNDYILLCKKS